MVNFAGLASGHHGNGDGARRAGFFSEAANFRVQFVTELGGAVLLERKTKYKAQPKIFTNWEENCPKFSEK